MKKVILLIVFCVSLYADNFNQCRSLITDLEKRYNDFVSAMYWHKLLVCTHQDFNVKKDYNCTSEEYEQKTKEVQELFNSECR